MKPFDLEAAKRGEPIQTRDGRKAKYIGYADELPSPVVYQVGGHIHAVLDSGLLSIGGKSTLDIFMHEYDE